MYVCLYVCVYTHLCLSVSIYLSSVCLSVCLPTYLPTYHLSLYICTFRGIWLMLFLETQLGTLLGAKGSRRYGLWSRYPHSQTSTLAKRKGSGVPPAVETNSSICQRGQLHPLLSPYELARGGRPVCKPPGLTYTPLKKYLLTDCIHNSQTIVPHWSGCPETGWGTHSLRGPSGKRAGGIASTDSGTKQEGQTVGQLHTRAHRHMWTFTHQAWI